MSAVTKEQMLLALRSHRREHGRPAARIRVSSTLYFTMIGETTPSHPMQADPTSGVWRFAGLPIQLDDGIHSYALDKT